MRHATVLLALALAGAALVSAQGALRTEPATLMCPSVLGQGESTGRTFCDVQIGRDPAAGVVIPLPPRRGDLVLTFDLHNRHLYSEDQIQAGRGFRIYTATIGALTDDNTLISRAIVQSEFRSAVDLFDRVLGGGGPGGLKAVAPTGFEPIAITIGGPFESERSVCLLGEHLVEGGPDGQSQRWTVEGRPIAVVSRVMLQYRPRGR
jgi:hypothetical protein